MPADQSVTWVLTSDTNTCRFYDYSKKKNQLKLIKEIQHPENKMRDIELTSDKSGHFESNHSGYGSFTQESDPKEIKIDHFARELAKELEHGRTANAYKELILIIAPHMYGLILQHMNKHVKAMMTHHIEKNMLHENEQALLTFLHEQTMYPQA